MNEMKRKKLIEAQTCVTRVIVYSDKKLSFGYFNIFTVYIEMSHIIQITFIVLNHHIYVQKTTNQPTHVLSIYALTASSFFNSWVLVRLSKNDIYATMRSIIDTN